MNAERLRKTVLMAVDGVTGVMDSAEDSQSLSVRKSSPSGRRRRSTAHLLTEYEKPVKNKQVARISGATTCKSERYIMEFLPTEPVIELPDTPTAAIAKPEPKTPQHLLTWGNCIEEKTEVSFEQMSDIRECLQHEFDESEQTVLANWLLHVTSPPIIMKTYNDIHRRSLESPTSYYDVDLIIDIENVLFVSVYLLSYKATDAGSDNNNTLIRADVIQLIQASLTMAHEQQDNITLSLRLTVRLLTALCSYDGIETNWLASAIANVFPNCKYVNRSPEGVNSLNQNRIFYEEVMSVLASYYKSKSFSDVILCRDGAIRILEVIQNTQTDSLLLVSSMLLIHTLVSTSHHNRYILKEVGVKVAIQLAGSNRHLADSPIELQDMFWMCVWSVYSTCCNTYSDARDFVELGGLIDAFRILEDGIKKDRRRYANSLINQPSPTRYAITHQLLLFIMQTTLFILFLKKTGQLQGKVCFGKVVSQRPLLDLVEKKTQQRNQIIKKRERVNQTQQ